MGRRYPSSPGTRRAGDHRAVNVRKFVVRAHSRDELVELGSLTPQAAAVLEAAVVAGLNIIVAGDTQAGKTTLLNCLLSAVPAPERVITCEEVFGLVLPELPQTTAHIVAPGSLAPSDWTATA